jgi:murein DD-endopeptidase MepM/ murein hydrolase activator NlpD
MIGSFRLDSRPFPMNAASFSFISASILFASSAGTRSAEPFLLPTANRAIYEPGGEERYFVGTVGKSWMSGTFGCVRTEGWQLHEGLDIRCLQRDKHGEPVDPVLATADGTVVYLNTRPSLSNYGNYLILVHQIDGVQIYSLYAHLKEIHPGLKLGQTVKAGDEVATMGRTSNTGQTISKDRAHVHFELDLVLNDRFPEWYRKTFPGQRNDHGVWNGQNLVGLDPRLVLLAQHEQGVGFRFADFIRTQTDLCRILVRAVDFPWLKRYPGLIKPNPVAQKEGIAGYEIALNYVGLPFELIPRAASEIKGKSKFQLLFVNATEKEKHPCRKLVTQKGGHWELAGNGIHLLELLTFP